jgi:predicted DNA-binding protein
MVEMPKAKKTRAQKAEAQLVTVRLTKEMHEKLRAISFETRTPIAEMLRNATSAWLTEREAKAGKK